MGFLPVTLIADHGVEPAEEFTQGGDEGNLWWFAVGLELGEAVVEEGDEFGVLAFGGYEAEGFVGEWAGGYGKCVVSFLIL